MLVVDSGNLAMAALQYPVFAATLKKMGYQAINVGRSEAQNLDLFRKAMEEQKLTTLGVLDGAPEGVRPYVIKKLAGLRIGLVGLSPNNPPFNEADFRPKRIEVVEKARKQADLLILLSQLGRYEDMQILKATAGSRADLLIGGVEYSFGQETTTIEGVSVPITDTKGQHLGVVEVTPRAGGKPTLAYRQVLLDDAYAPDPTVDKMVKDFYKEQSAKMASTGAKAPNGSGPVMIDANAAISAAQKTRCGQCHAAQESSWQKSAHARALRTLRESNKLVPECLGCHSTSYKQSGTISANATAPSGVECESCHADTPAHGPQAPPKRDRKKIAASCEGCHTAERSPKFDLPSYWARTTH